MSDETVDVKVQAAIGGLQTGMAEAQRVVQSSTIRMSESFAGMGTAIARFQAPLLAIGALLAGGKLFTAAITETARLADELDVLSQKTGIAAVELSKLRYAATLADVEFGALDSGFKKLSVSMSDALLTPTSKAASAFRAMGLDVKAFNGSLTAALDAVADKFHTYEDGASKAALAVALFGRSGTDMIPMLNLGSSGIQKLKDESDKLGATMSGPLIAAGVAYDDSMKRLHAVTEGFKNQISLALLPTLTKMADFFVTIGPSALRGFVVLIDLLSITVDMALTPIRALASLLVALGHALSGDFRAAWEAIKEIPADLDVMGRAMERARARMVGGLPPVRIVAGSGKGQAPALAEPGKPENVEARFPFRPSEPGLSSLEKSFEAIAKAKQKLIENMIAVDKMWFEEDQRTADAYFEGWVRTFDSIGSIFRTMVDGVLRGTETLGQAWNNLARNFLLTMVANIEKAFEVWLATELTKKALGAANAKTSIFNDAYQAAAGAFKSVVGIPIIGPILAPIAAGAAFAAVAAFGSGIKSAAGGYDIPGGVNPMTQLHAREMVLPASLADGLRGLIASGGGAGGGDVHIHTFDVATFRDYARKNRNELVPALRDLARDGALSSTRIG